MDLCRGSEFYKVPIHFPDDLWSVVLSTLPAMRLLTSLKDSPLPPSFLSPSSSNNDGDEDEKEVRRGLVERVTRVLWEGTWSNKISSSPNCPLNDPINLSTLLSHVTPHKEDLEHIFHHATSDTTKRNCKERTEEAITRGEWGGLIRSISLLFNEKVFMVSPSSSSATSQKMTRTQSRTKIRNLTTRWGVRGSLGQIASTTWCPSLGLRIGMKS